MTTLQYPVKIIPGSPFEKVMEKIDSSKFAKLQEKLGVAQMILAQSSKRGGAPFVYIFSSIKNHFLADITNKLHVDDQGTDGRNYYWHPDLLERLTAQEISVIQMHETFHTVFQHCDRNRTLGKNARIWNIAVDYIVNGTIEHDFRKTGYIPDHHSNGEGQTEHPLWNGNLHKPLFLKDLIAGIKKETEDLKSGKVNKSKNENKNKPVKEEDLRCMADYSTYGRDAEDIYEEIMAASQNLTNEMLEQLLAKMGIGDGDVHMPTEVDKHDLLQEILQSMQYAKAMGNTPAGLEEQLGKLMEPKLSWQDLCRSAFSKFIKDKGSIKDWSRFARRHVSYNNYRPKYKEYKIRWAAFLDCSGSMSDSDIAYCVSQLRALEGRSEGVVIPFDTEPYWKQKTNIYTMSDLPKVKVCGRGGTCAKSIFEEYPKMIGTDFDVIIVASDMGIFDMNELPKPRGSEVVWINCSSHEVSVPFGRCAPLRNF